MSVRVKIKFPLTQDTPMYPNYSGEYLFRVFCCKVLTSYSEVVYKASRDFNTSFNNLIFRIDRMAARFALVLVLALTCLAGSALVNKYQLSSYS